MKKLLILFVTGLLVVATTTCKKYEDGPAFSLYPKKFRLCNYWYPDQIFQNGNDISEQWTSGNMQCYGIQYNRDGTYEASATNYATSGKWELLDHKKILRRMPAAGDTLDFKILRLTTRQLWLYWEEDSIEFHFGQEASKWCSI
jgi:hypothetical protein